MRVGAGSIVIPGGQLDFTIRDSATGAVLRDSKAERLAAVTSELNELSKKAQHSQELRSMLASWSAGIDDSENELTHQYEIRDILAKHFGSDMASRRALGISSSEWSTFGRLANDEPLLEGRHRGKHHAKLRHATEDQLRIVRRLASEWVRKFAATL